MNQEIVMKLLQNSIKTIILLSSPLLISILCVGLLINIFQVSTQINEQTLSFIPKILIIFFSSLFFGPWMLKGILEYIIFIFQNIPIVIKI
ncbi:flagellar biosynthesis protein FliQ [Buchnera aphidicola]|uniref:Flagellar biosynthetic protein FliQ n=1 Tax=Buchnera aphidicola subsp. Tuberolachnus salignus TaxID=98804 RepID=A0A160SYN2_BUCTT|nr:flagellar biosynthesis protein FliQ [Buchnera aphidicola]CUR53036.1 Flagellar biosynthetic protein FliQ [Buchnera aphidicola (Tuberolachnus salignus)]